ncbi:hypothetical protein V8C86DRAFT_3130767, partial [Haematococcus lacustris]
MSFGYPEPKGATILLRGGSAQQLSAVKSVLKFAVLAAWAHRLEAAFLADEMVAAAASAGEEVSRDIGDGGLEAYREMMRAVIKASIDSSRTSMADSNNQSNGVLISLSPHTSLWDKSLLAQCEEAVRATQATQAAVVGEITSTAATTTTAAEHTALSHPASPGQPTLQLQHLPPPTNPTNPAMPDQGQAHAAAAPGEVAQTKLACKPTHDPFATGAPPACGHTNPNNLNYPNHLPVTASSSSTALPPPAALTPEGLRGAEPVPAGSGCGGAGSGQAADLLFDGRAPSFALFVRGSEDDGQGQGLGGLGCGWGEGGGKGEGPTQHATQPAVAGGGGVGMEEGGGLGPSGGGATPPIPMLHIPSHATTAAAATQPGGRGAGGDPGGQLGAHSRTGSWAEGQGALAASLQSAHPPGAKDGVGGSSAGGQGESGGEEGLGGAGARARVGCSSQARLLALQGLQIKQFTRIQATHYARHTKRAPGEYTLQQFILQMAKVATIKCNSITAGVWCNDMGQNHARTFLHRNARITISTTALSNSTEVMKDTNHQIYMWLRPKGRGQVGARDVRRVLLSKEACCLSMAHFFQLMTTGDGLCFPQHSSRGPARRLHYDYVRYFGVCDRVVCMYQDAVTPYDLALPPSQVQYSYAAQLKWLQADAEDLMREADVAFAEIKQAMQVQPQLLLQQQQQQQQQHASASASACVTTGTSPSAAAASQPRQSIWGSEGATAALQTTSTVATTPTAPTAQAPTAAANGGGGSAVRAGAAAETQAPGAAPAPAST